jgi:hypothetical protein
MKPDTPPPKWTSGTFSIGYALVKRLNLCWERTTQQPILSELFDRISQLRTRLPFAPQGPPPPPAPPELDAVLKEIENAISAKLYYLAIMVALVVPDICACLEFDPDDPKPRANRETYARWCNENIAGLNHLTGDDLYNLRGGVVHKGHFGHEKSRFTRVFFIGPESPIKAPRGSIINGQFRLGPQQELWSGPILLFDVDAFCDVIITGARQWAATKKDDPFVQKNLSKLVCYRPNGIPNFLVGVPTVG